MSFRSYIKVGKRAEYEGRYSKRINPSDGSGGGSGDCDLSDYVTKKALAADQARQDAEVAVDQERQDEEIKKLIEEEVSGAIRSGIYADSPPATHPDFDGAEAALVEGDIWYDTSNENTPYRYIKDEWVAQSRPPIYSDDEPASHPKLQGTSSELKQGDVWFNTTDGLEEHIWTGTEWVSTGAAYVKKKGGDTMEGPLKISGGRDLNTAGESTIEALNVDSGQNSALHLQHNGSTQVYVGSTQTSFQGDIKLNVPGRAIFAGSDKKGFVINTAGVFYDGAYSDDRHVATKKNVDDTREFLQQEIIELEEEIDAIAPSVERGTWMFNLGGLAGSRGQITMYDGMNGSGSPIGLFKNAQSVWLNELDNNGTPHGFASVNVGDLIELFVEGQPDYGLFTVIDVHDETDGVAKYWVIDVEFVRSLEAGSTADNQDNLRVKIFNPPSAGDASQYVLKTGGLIEGELRWNPYKPEADGNPSENAYAGIKVFSRIGGSKYLLYATTGAKYSPEELSTDVAPTQPKSITNKEYVDGVVAGLATEQYVDSKLLTPSFERYPVMLHSGPGYKYKYVDKGILSSSQFTADSNQASGNTLYLSRLWSQKRGWTQVVNYDRTQNSTIEVWEYGDTPVLIIRAGIHTMAPSEYTQQDVKLTLNRFWSKPGYTFSNSKDYSFMLNGLTERDPLIVPLS